jgi:anti-anti-sigma factor
MVFRGNHVRARRQGHAWVLAFPKEFGADVEEHLAPAAEQALASDATLIVLDFTSVEFTNSAGIGAIVDVLRRARERGVAVVLAGVKGQPRIIIERVGLFGFARAYETVDEALRGTSAP